MADHDARSAAWRRLARMRKMLRERASRDSTAARVGIASLVSGVAMVGALSAAAPSPAAPLVIEHNIEVARCTQPAGQVCSEVPSVTGYFTTSAVRVTFIASSKHCSKMIARVMIDGFEWDSAWWARGRVAVQMFRSSVNRDYTQSVSRVRAFPGVATQDDWIRGEATSA